MTAETPVVKDVAIIDPANPSVALDLSDTTFIRFKCSSGEFSQRMRFTLRFHYTEQFVFDTTEVSEHYVDWQFGEQDMQADAGNETVIYTVRRDAFLTMLAQRIPENAYVRRISGKIDLIYLSAAKDLVTYITVQVANSHSVTDLPNFTNVEGGYGLFSARTTTVFPNYMLDADTRYALRVNTVMQGLNFVR